MSDILMIGGAIVGAGLGLVQQGKRQTAAARQEMMARWTYEAYLKRNKSQKSILEGNLTAGAMGATSNNREAAIQAYQAESAGKLKAGLSGVSGGTPLFKVASDMALNRTRLAEMNQNVRLQYDAQIQGARASGQDIDMNLQNAMWGLQESVDQLNYVESPVAMAMSIGTGIASGASMANNINASVTQITDYSVEDNFANAFDKIAGIFGKSDVVPSAPSSGQSSMAAISAQPMGIDTLSFKPLDPVGSFQMQPSPNQGIGYIPPMDFSLDLFQIPSIAGLMAPGQMAPSWSNGKRGGIGSALVF